MNQIKPYIIGSAFTFLAIAIFTSGAIADRLYGLQLLDNLIPQQSSVDIEQKIITDESNVVDVVGEVSDSVVTVSVKTPARRVLQFSPFGGIQSRLEGGLDQDIGSGFIVTPDGLIVTNKHVVSQDTTYKVITKDGQEHEVVEISRDPDNDIAILKIDVSGMKPIELGDSSDLKVGQFVIAIGTALGEFRHTVTTGVISGLGRGITAGSAYEGYIQRLDDVIQTDAAINPGNSGGPLLNSAGQVIGVNVAIASSAQNIAFAIPIDTVKARLEQFNSAGHFEEKPFLGVRYQMIAKQAAILNDVPQGAFVIEVVEGSVAQKAGLQIDDIITKFGGSEINSENDLADAISNKKIGDSVEVTVWRDGEEIKIKITFSSSE